MLSKPSSALPVFEEKVLVVAREGWDSNVECCSCCARIDESWRRRKRFTPFLCKDSSSVLTCLVFLILWSWLASFASQLLVLTDLEYWQDPASLQWGEVLWACCSSAAVRPRRRDLEGRQLRGGVDGAEPLGIRSWRSRGRRLRE